MTSLLRGYFAPSASQKATVGDTKMSMVNADHLGWLLCDGRSLEVSKFRILYNVIGNAYGGDNEHFNLPSPAGRVLGVIGSGTNLTERLMGDTVGEETHQLIEDELPDMTKTTITNSGHIHSHNANGGSPGYGLIYRDGSNTATVADSTAGEPNVYATPIALALNTENAHTHTIQIGDDQPHNNMQPTLFVGNMFVFSGKLGLGTYPFTSGSKIY